MKLTEDNQKQLEIAESNMRRLKATEDNWKQLETTVSNWSRPKATDDQTKLTWCSRLALGWFPSPCRWCSRTGSSPCSTETSNSSGRIQKSSRELKRRFQRFPTFSHEVSPIIWSFLIFLSREW
jgi:hypothetical protein